MLEKIVVFNIGWMQKYQGLDNDPISGKAGYIVENEHGHEIFNFLSFEGYMYGFVQPSGRKPYLERKINIQRLGAKNNAEAVTGVFVAWVARNPEKGGKYLVGWYEDATVYQDYQLDHPSSNRKLKGGSAGYYVTAKAINCVLLSPDRRRLPVPSGPREGKVKGGMGQSNVWFADNGKPNAIQFRQDLFQFVEAYKKNQQELMTFPDEVASEQKLYEGSTRQVVVNNYERNSNARQKCIAHYGAKCWICEFDFEQKYGEVGVGYIHVHHLKPLSEINEQYQVDPIEDLLPVCPNCHAIIHRRKPPYTPDEVKAFLAQAKAR